MSSFFKKQLKNKKQVAIIVITMLFVVPLVLNYLLPLKIISTKMGLDGWLGFWGSFLGGIFSIIALWVTIQYADFQGRQAESFAKIENDKLKIETALLRQQQLRLIEMEIEMERINNEYKLIENFVNEAVDFLLLKDINTRFGEKAHHYMEYFSSELQYLLWKYELWEYKDIHENFYIVLSDYIFALSKSIISEKLSFTINEYSFTISEFFSNPEKYAEILNDNPSIMEELNKQVQKFTSNFNSEGNDRESSEFIDECFEKMKRIIDVKTMYIFPLLQSSKQYLKVKRETFEEQKNQLRLELLQGYSNSINKEDPSNE